MKPGYEPVTDEREIPALIGRLGARTVIYDIEPLVAHWDSAQTALDEGLAAVTAAVAAIGGVRGAVLCHQLRPVPVRAAGRAAGPAGQLPGVGAQAAADGAVRRPAGAGRRGR